VRRSNWFKSYRNLEIIARNYGLEDEPKGYHIHIQDAKKRKRLQNTKSRRRELLLNQSLGLQ
jgi:hypothetical protein